MAVQTFIKLQSNKSQKAARIQIPDPFEKASSVSDFKGSCFQIKWKAIPDCCSLYIFGKVQDDLQSTWNFIRIARIITKLINPLGLLYRARFVKKMFSIPWLEALHGCLGIRKQMSGNEMAASVSVTLLFHFYSFFSIGVAKRHQNNWQRITPREALNFLI